jgi:hypothetical protein
MNEGPARPFIFCGVGWVEPTAKPTMSMPVIHSRKNIETTPPRRWAVSVVLCDGCWSPVCHFRLGRWAVSMILCEQCVTWSRWVSPLALPTLPPAGAGRAARRYVIFSPVFPAPLPSTALLPRSLLPCPRDPRKYRPASACTGRAAWPSLPVPAAVAGCPVAGAPR